MYLYKYMKYENFIKTIENKELYFVNPLTEWDDKKEGEFFKKIQTDEGQKEIIEEILNYDRSTKSLWFHKLKLISQGSINESDATFKDWFGTRCMSWTINSYPNKMWNEYGYENRAVRVKVELGDIKKLKYKSHIVSGYKVEYRDSFPLKEIVKSIYGLRNELYIANVFKYKYENYKFEDEYRFYISNIGNNLENEVKGTNCIYVPIEMNLSEFVKEVVPHPQASKEFRAELEYTCKKFNFNYLIKE